MRAVFTRVSLVVGLVVAWRAFVWVRGVPWGGVDAPPLVLGPEPEQEELPEPWPVRVQRDGRPYLLLRTHRFAVTGKVLSATEYDWVWTNPLYDVDLGLAWGDRVAELEERFDFHQNGRWLFWRTAEALSEADRRYLTSHVGNLHLIPAEGALSVDRALRRVGVGDLVRIEGYLVTIQDAGTNELARSSTRRDDTGDGACEIVWVDRLQVNETRYR